MTTAQDELRAAADKINTLEHEHKGLRAKLEAEAQEKARLRDFLKTAEALTVELRNEQLRAEEAHKAEIAELRAGLTAARGGEESMTKMCDAYVVENQQLSDRAEAAEAALAKRTADAERYLCMKSNDSEWIRLLRIYVDESEAALDAAVDMLRRGDHEGYLKLVQGR